VQLQLLGRPLINASIRMGDHRIMFCDWCAILLCESWTDILIRSFTKPAQKHFANEKSG
jgi:hypothetical protein